MTPERDFGPKKYPCCSMAEMSPWMNVAGSAETEGMLCWQDIVYTEVCDPKTMRRPFNPMVNAGAIAVASLIKKESATAGVRSFVEKMQLAAGRKLKIDRAVLASESATGNRNRAIAYLMLNFGIIDDDVNHPCTSIFRNARGW